MSLDLRLNPSPATRVEASASWFSSLPLAEAPPGSTVLPGLTTQSGSPAPVPDPSHPGPAEVCAPVLQARFTAIVAEADILVVPAGTCIHGDVQAPSVHVKGTVHGRVTAGRGPLVVDRGGVVHGTVEGQGAVVIAGQVWAPPEAVAAVVSRGPLKLGATACVRGNVRYTDIAIYKGARVMGVVRPFMS